MAGSLLLRRQSSNFERQQRQQVRWEANFKLLWAALTMQINYDPPSSFVVAAVVVVL